MIEVKLSQGAKPGQGGVLPGAKVTTEIATARGVPAGVDCLSPASHSAFSTPIELLHFIERLRMLSGGKPTGFKLAIGHPWEFFAIVKAMLATGITPDFIVVDGGEGGTGAAPVEFSDHVGTPLQEALLLVHNTLVGAGLRERVKIGASGKIVTAFDIARTIALGADWCNSARGFMFALGCVQSQSCHTDRCPTGVATQDAQRQKALVVPDKTARVAHFHQNTMKALAQLIAAAGLTHPSQLAPHHIVRRVSPNQVKLASALLPYLTPRRTARPGAAAPAAAGVRPVLADRAGRLVPAAGGVTTTGGDAYGVFAAVERRIENPCVGGSIPPRATKNIVHATSYSCKWALSFLDFVVLGAGLFPVKQRDRSLSAFHELYAAFSPLSRWARWTFLFAAIEC